MARKSIAEITKLLKTTSKMKNTDAAKHLGISAATLYKWKEKARGTTATKKPVAVKPAVKAPSKKVINLVNALKDKIAKLEKELS